MDGWQLWRTGGVLVQPPHTPKPDRDVVGGTSPAAGRMLCGKKLAPAGGPVPGTGALCT